MDLQDDAILAALRRIARAVDPVPDTVRDAARAAFLTRDLDGEIAALIADSREQNSQEQSSRETDTTAEVAFEPARAEDDPAGRWLLSFAGGGIQIDLEIDDDGGQVRLLGLLSGAPVADCEVQAERRSCPAEIDDLGRFIVPGLAHGPIRLRCRLVDGRRVTTTWVRV
jgi:hypothetical protein